MREYMEKNVKSALSRPLRGRYRRLLSIGVSALLSVSTFLTVIPQTETIIYADTSSKAIVLVDNGVASNIKNPTSGTWNRVYFGNYKQSSDGSGGFNEDPIKWRVLQNNTTDKTLFLLADQSLDVQQYNMRFESTSWAVCTLHTWLNDTFMNSAFSDSREKQAIKETQVMTTGSVDTNDKIFLLSKDEVINNTYGFPNNTSADDSRVSSKTDFVESINPTSSTGTNNWWLRSPGSRDDYVSMVYDQGNVSDLGFPVELGGDVRPAFNLNLSSIILTSAAAGGKNPATAGTLEAPGDYEGTEWKLTLRDSKMITGIGTAGVSRSGSAITVPYTVTGDNAGTANRISVLITDKAYTASDAVIKYYGKLAITGSIGASGTGTFTLPADYNTSWKVYILGEQINGDKKTDYASTPVEITIPGKPALTVTAKDKTYPYNGEIQGPGDMVYNDPDEIADMVTVEGLQSGDTLTSIEVDGQGQEVGDYDLTPDAATVNGSSASAKYDVTYVKGKLHITSTGKSYTVTFKVKNGAWNDGTKADKTVTLSGGAGDTLRLSADQIPDAGSKPDTDYKEGSWDVTPDTKTAITADTTYTYTYANDGPQPDKYTITFDPNGGKGDMAPQKADKGETVQLKANEFTRSGYAFKYWNTKADDSGEKYEDKQSLKAEGDMTLYAQWKKDEPGPTPTPTPTPRPKWRPHHHDDDDADDIPSEPAKPAAVSPDTVEGFFTALGQPVPGVTMGRTVQGVAAQAALNASRPAGYVQAFTFNMAVNGKVEYTLKNGVLTIIIPKEFRKAGRTFAIMALDKNGKAVIFNDTDTNADTVTAAINVEGYAFSLIYKD